MSEALLLVLVMLGLGKVFALARLLPDNAAEVLNRLVIWLLLPALVLKAVSGVRVDTSLLVLIATPWLLAILVVAAVWGAARRFAWPRPVVGCLLVCCALGNTAFLGYPMIEASLGANALRYAVIYDQLGSFLLLSSYGLVVIALMAGGERPTVAGVVRKVLTFPSFLALILGLLPIAHPPELTMLIERLAAMLVPVAMFAVGLQLKIVPPRAYAVPALFGLALKLLVLPAAAFLIGRLAGASGEVLTVNVLQSAMPSMITAGALAAHARLAPELASALVGYGILISLLWLPLLAGWLHSLAALPG